MPWIAAAGLEVLTNAFARGRRTAPFYIKKSQESRVRRAAGGTLAATSTGRMAGLWMCHLNIPIEIKRYN
jgi:hypothetical protein